MRISHYRDRAGDEVDLILEAAASVGPRDARWLLKLRDTLGDRFTAGIIRHPGMTSGPFGERISAVPIDALWTT